MHSELSLRELECQVGLITRADGSAQLSQGETSVIAGTYGPGEVKSHKELPERITIDVSLIPKGISGVDIRAKESFVRENVDSCVLTALHPRSSLSVALQALEDDGGLWSCLINAACLALIDSSIPMKSLFAAVTVAVDTVSSKVIVDPDSKQLKTCNCVIIFVFENRNSKLLSAHFESGSCSDQKFQECIRNAQKASETIFTFYRKTIERKFEKELK